MKKTVLLLAALIILLPATLTFSQLKGHNVLGDFGLNAGTQGTPGINVIAPVYLYNADKVIDNNGNEILKGPKLTTFFTGIGATYVTKMKVLGANLGGTLILPFIRNRIQADSLNVKSDFAFTDIYVQPVNLGWHFKQADVTFSYGLYIPTGKFEPGGSDNSGLGMLSNEFALGGTVFFDKKKNWNLATMAFFEIHSKKKDTETKVGNILSLEGGLGKTFYYKVNNTFSIPIANAGIAYYAQFKLTEDNVQIGTNTYALSKYKDRIFGVGPEANIFFPKAKIFVDAKYLFEFGARTRMQGGTFVLTLAYNAASFFKLPKF